MTSASLAPDDFVGCVAGNLRAAARAVSRFYDTELRSVDLPGGAIRITQVAILAQVHRLQPVTVSDLAAVLSSERSALARDIAVLERDGLLETRSKADDRRAREVTITTDGDRALRECLPAWTAAQRAMVDALGAADVGRLVDLSTRLVIALDESGSR